MWLGLSRTFNQHIHGGDWADSQPGSVRHNLRWFWFDGFFSAASDNIVLTYLVLYVLSLGASGAQIGWMSSLASLSATLILLPGAALVERIGRRKQITLAAGGIGARLFILVLVLAPIGFSGQELVSAAIILVVLRDTLGNLALPAWVSLTADIVPITWRGRYFGLRNIYMTIASIVVVLTMGELITRTEQPLGYQIALAVAFGLGMISTFSFAQIREAPNPPARSILHMQKDKYSIISYLSPLLTMPSLLAFSLTSALWNFSLNIAGPFFNVYMVQVLGATPTMVGFLGIISSLSGLPAQQILGSWVDRWGPRRIMMVTGFLIPILPFAWLFISATWQIIPINILSGFLWAGYSLSSFNLLLEMTLPENRARTSALYQVLTSFALAVGAAFGGVLVSIFSYKAVFLASAIGRWLAAFLFARFVSKRAS
jgi:MFS family permease